MKTKIIYLILMLSLNMTAQELHKLEKDIQHTYITDTAEIKRKAERIFRIDPYNETAIYYLTESYRSTDNDYAVQEIFNNLQTNDPNNPLSYLLSAKYQYQTASVTDTSMISELLKAYKLDPNSFEVNYLLGVSYYQLFHDTQVLDSTKNLEYFASQSRFYLAESIRNDSSSLIYLKYLIIQLSNFLGDIKTAAAFKQTEIIPIVNEKNIPIKLQPYFPVSKFIELPEGWDTDFKVDVLWEVCSIRFLLGWFTNQLQALEEPIIFNQLNDTIYRFTWLRSFHQPVAIRIQMKKEEILLRWKMADGAGGFEPGNLIVSKEKVLSRTKWLKYQKLLTKINFWNLSTTQPMELLGNDGSRWIIEGIENGKYNVINRWTPKETDLQELGKYLISLTDLKIPKEDFY